MTKPSHGVVRDHGAMLWRDHSTTLHPSVTFSSQKPAIQEHLPSREEDCTVLNRPHPLVEKKLSGLREMLLRMGGLAEAILAKSLRALRERDLALARAIKGDDLPIDRLDVEIDQAILELLALQAPVAHDLRQTIAIKTAALDLERVGDLARNIAESAMRLIEMPKLSLPPILDSLSVESRRALACSLDAFADMNPDEARAVLAADDRIDAQEAEVIRGLVETMRSRPEISSQAVELILIAKSLERIGDHATNIAEDVIMVTEFVNLKHAQKIRV
jgi:phosphate transport system protein